MRRYDSLVADVSASVVAGAAVINGLHVFNTHNAVLYFMLFDKATGPSADEDPVFVAQLTAAGTAGADLHLDGAMLGRFRLGIAWGTSSTADDYTANGAAKLAVHMSYT